MGARGAVTISHLKRTRIEFSLLCSVFPEPFFSSTARRQLEGREGNSYRQRRLTDGVWAAELESISGGGGGRSRRASLEELRRFPPPLYC